MTMRTTPSKPLRAVLDEASGRGPVVLRGGTALGGPEVSRQGLATDLPIGLLGDDAFRMVVTFGSWRTQATFDQSYPGVGTSCSDRGPRASRIGRPSPWCSPQVVALERELESTKRELRQAQQALDVEARCNVEAAQARDGRSNTIQRGRAEATEDARTTCRDKEAMDLLGYVDAVAPAERVPAPPGPAILEAARERFPTTLDGRSEPSRRVDGHIGPHDVDGPTVDDAPSRLPTKIVFVVVDEDAMNAVLGILRAADLEAVGCASGEAFLRTGRHGSEACLLTGACVAGVGGLDLVKRLRAQGSLMPAVVITGRGDVPMAVRAMRAGVSDVIEEPVVPETLLTCVGRALERASEAERILGLRGDAARHVAGLTPRQREIMASVLAGHPSKNIAADLGISRRTVENHRASIMRRTGARSLPALTRLAIASEPLG